MLASNKLVVLVVQQWGSGAHAHQPDVIEFFLYWTGATIPELVDPLETRAGPADHMYALAPNPRPSLLSLTVNIIANRQNLVRWHVPISHLVIDTCEHDLSSCQIFCQVLQTL